MVDLNFISNAGSILLIAAVVLLLLVAMGSKEKDAIIAKIQKELPKNWIVRFSTRHEDRVFYFNQDTGCATWTFPDTSSLAASKQASVEKIHSTMLLCTKSAQNVCDRKMPTLKELHGSQPISPPESLKAGKLKNKPLKRGLIESETSETINSHVLSRHEPSEIQHTVSPKKKRKKKKKKKGGDVIDPPSDTAVACGTSDFTSPLNRSNDSTNTLKSDVHSLLASTTKKKLSDTFSKSFNSPTTSAKEQSSNIYPQTFGCCSPKFDVEMVDISLKSPQQTTSSTTSTFIYVVVDTNVFLGPDGLRDIDAIVDWYPLPEGHYRRAIIVIPWIVLQELDCLKTQPSTAVKARRAVVFLNRHFSSKRPGLRGQTIMEAASLLEKMSIEVNDDRILQCCFYFSNLPGNHITVLYSKDINLCNKAMASQFKCFSTLNLLVKGITDLCQSQNPLFDISESTPVLAEKKSSDFSDSTNLCDDGRKAPSQNNSGRPDCVLPSPDCVLPSPDVVLPETEAVVKSVDEVFASTKHVAKTALGAILEAEMKKAFEGNLWLEVIVRKPPWSLMDILQCIKKHWIAVFHMAGMERLLTKQVEDLIKCISSSAYCPSPIKQNHAKFLKLAYDTVCSSFVLVSGMGKHHMQNPTVKGALPKLKKYEKIVAKWLADGTNEAPVPQVETSKDEPAASDFIEDIVVDQRSADEEVVKHSPEETRILFWQILDKVWGCILEHCVAIFRSLNFISSPAFNQTPPELRQELSRAITTEIPSPSLAVHVIPLLKELIDGFLKALERFILVCNNSLNSSPAFPDCLDLLQTLWTITRAFSLNVGLDSITPSTIYNACQTSHDRSKLFIGHQKLHAVATLLRECSEYVTSQMS